MNSKAKQNLIVLLTLVVLVAVTANNAAWAQSSVDNSELPCFPPIRDQGNLGSSKSFATTYYQLTHNVGLQLGWDNKNEDNTTKFSPKWTYNFLNAGSPDIRTSLTEHYNLLEKHGAVTWAEFPYDDDYEGWCLDTDAWKNAMNFRINPPESIISISNDEGLQQLKQMLNNEFVLTFNSFIDWWQYTTISDDPSTTDVDAFVGQSVVFWQNGPESVIYSDGGQGLTCVGYNDTLWVDINGNGTFDAGEKGALKIANSLGTDWGNSGYMWIAYDALRKVSAVPGGPSEDRVQAVRSGACHLPVRTGYTPRLIAEFTINHTKRNEFKLELGIGDSGAQQPSTTWRPHILYFDGGATPIDGTFAFDFTDIMPLEPGEYRYFIRLYDREPGDFLTMTEFMLIDTETGTKTYSTAVPVTAEDNWGKRKGTYAYLNYSLDGPDFIAAPSNLEGSVSSGTVRLTWNDNSNNEEGFYIERGTWLAGRPMYGLVAEVNAGVTTYSESLGAGRYFYRVQAFNQSISKVSPYSNEINLRVKN